MKRSGLILIGVTAIASLGIGAAFAQGPGGPEGHGRPPGGGAGALGQVLRGFMQPLPPPDALADLDITTDQQTKIQSIMSSERSSSKTDMESLHDLADQGRKLALSSSYTDSAASDLAAKEAAKAEPLVLTAQKLKSEIMTSVLTADQRSQIATLESDASRHQRSGAPVARRVDMLTQELDLTAAEQSDVTTLLTSASSTQADDMKSIAAVWTTYQKDHSSGAYDASAVAAAYKSAEPTVADFLASDMKTQHGIWSLLTDEQKTKFASASSRGPGGPPSGGFGGRGANDRGPGGGGSDGVPPAGGPPDGGPPDGGQGGPPPSDQ